MALLLIRHGETELNAARVVQFPHTPLGKTGMAQADRLGESLSGRAIDIVLTSDYVRARTTADALAKHVGAPLVESPFLRERNFGEIRGTPYDELGETDLFGLDFSPPGGETWPVFHDRVDRAWNEIVQHVGTIVGDLAVVTHGLVLRSLLERKLDLSSQVVELETVVANTSVTTVEFEPPWRVLDLANVNHLEGGANDVAPV